MFLLKETYDFLDSAGLWYMPFTFRMILNVCSFGFEIFDAVGTENKMRTLRVTLHPWKFHLPRLLVQQLLTSLN